MSRMRTPNEIDVRRYNEQVISWVREYGGFENIQEDDLYIPTGWNGSRKYCKDPELAGSIMRENMKVRPHLAPNTCVDDDNATLQLIIHSWKPFIVTAGVSETEVDSWVADAGKELETPGKLRATIELRELHGRQVNGLNERYKLPADSEEMQRLNLQHRSQTIAMGGLYPEGYAKVVQQRLGAHREEAIQIADFGSGSGDWISAMAREFPHAQAIGIDLAPSSPVDVPSNVKFETRDINQETSEYYGKFDMIQARSVTMGVSDPGYKVGAKLTLRVAQIADYPVFLESVWRYLKPGGIFMILDGFSLLYDTDFNPSMSSAFSKLCTEAASKMQFPNGLGADFTGQVISWLRDHAGFTNVQVDNLYIPTGWNGSERYCKEPELAGSIMVENMKKIIGAFRPLLISAGVPRAEADSWIAEAEKELETPEMLKAYTRWIIICAQKSA
ncbi:hypothetical protein FRC06_010792 [Ceratobasidium sp. 370]|nr:hypothetical protein FRC06_010792 [Ceratobasidium sp. 370]